MKDLKKIGTVPGIRVQVYKRVDVQGGGIGSMLEPDGFEYADVEVYVDCSALAKAIGWKAMRSRTGLTKLQSGAVVLAAVNKRRKP